MTTERIGTRDALSAWAHAHAQSGALAVLLSAELAARGGAPDALYRLRVHHVPGTILEIRIDPVDASTLSKSATHDGIAD